MNLRFVGASEYFQRTENIAGVKVPLPYCHLFHDILLTWLGHEISGSYARRMYTRAHF